MERHISSYVDPHGFVFERGGAYFRAIHPDYAAFYRGLVSDGTAAALGKDFGLVSTALADDVEPPAPGGLVLRHARVTPESYCVEWSPSMLKDAALLTLDLALELAPRDLALQDAYPWNILFSGARPIFLDFTSIAPADRRLIWPAYEQYQAFFLRPLVLSAEGKGRAARALLLDNIDGIGLEEFYRLTSLGYRLRHPGLALGRLLDRQIQKRPALKKSLKERVERQSRPIDVRLRQAFLGRLRRRTAALRFEAAAVDPWEGYYSGIPAAVDREAKLAAVRGLLARLKPESVVDLGCNTGAFSLVAAESGARVIAVDGSESCIDSLYGRARRDGLPITPLIANLVTPTPGFGFLGRQYPPLPQRLRANTALCLGLMHHLHISGRQSFERIAALLDEVAEQRVIFEYVGRDDANIALLHQPRPLDYDLDSVRDALSAQFPRIETLPSDRASRSILLCSRA